MSTRRAFVETTLAAAAAALVAPRALGAEYESARGALDAIEGLSAQVVVRWQALRALPAARTFSQKLLDEHGRLRSERVALRKRLRLPVAAMRAAQASADARSLGALREAQNALMLAHAESLPALPDASAVDLIARHAIAASRHLTLNDLWIEAEDARG